MGWSRGSAATGTPSGFRPSAASCRFHPAYDGNCLVNAFAAGLASADAIFYSAASGVGMPVVYLGAKTGRDGVGGATMASAEFDATIEEKRPTVQVGDPFTEKRLMEACLELMATGAVISIQDMGAAGLTCSAVEMGDKGDLGIRLDLDRVPVREAGMTAYEMMLSESQERMLMVLRPEKEAEARAVFDKWDLDFAVVGETIPEDRFIVTLGGEVKADLPLKALSGTAPEYDRPWVPTPAPAPLGAGAGGGSGGGAPDADGEPEPLRAGVGLVAVRLPGDGGHGAAAGIGRGRGAGARDRQGASPSPRTSIRATAGPTRSGAGRRRWPRRTAT